MGARNKDRESSNDKQPVVVLEEGLRGFKSEGGFDLGSSDDNNTTSQEVTETTFGANDTSLECGEIEISFSQSSSTQSQQKKDR